MQASALSDVVSSQYAKWMYPQPIVDLPSWLSHNWQWFDPSHAHRLFWPDRDYQAGMDILVAGCGTNQAAVIAYTNPSAHVHAVDVSQPSLDHHRFLKEKYGLKNLELHRVPIEDIASLNRDFDLIMSTGVLHHMASPEAGMKALAGCLRQDGVAAIMLYAKYGRIGVDMMQSVFKELGLVQDEESIQVVRETLATLPSDHPVRSYMGIAPDLNYDAGLVDTFLHGRERNYSIQECLELVSSAGLVFQDLLFKAPYHPSPLSDAQFQKRLAGLSREQVWSVMEQINHRNGCHFFTACRKDRDVGQYRIDFGSDVASAYIPALRYRCTAQNRQICRYDWCMDLDATQTAILQLMDGHRTLHDIASLAGASGLMQTGNPEENFHAVKELFHMLWKLDFVSAHLQEQTSSRA